MEAADLIPFMDISVPVDAVLQGMRMSVGELLALSAGSVFSTKLASGSNLTVLAGGARLGIGESGALNGRVIVRMLRFGEEV